MKVTKPLGARVIVEEIITTLSMEERAKKAGLQIVIDEANKPRATQGRIVGVGTDPILRDAGCVEGAVVTFAPLSGVRVYIEGKEFRSLEFQELIAVESEATP